MMPQDWMTNFPIPNDVGPVWLKQQGYKILFIYIISLSDLYQKI